jgi:hypothetical protein
MVMVPLCCYVLLLAWSLVKIYDGRCVRVATEWTVWSSTGKNATFGSGHEQDVKNSIVAMAKRQIMSRTRSEIPFRQRDRGNSHSSSSWCILLQFERMITILTRIMLLWSLALSVEAFVPRGRNHVGSGGGRTVPLPLAVGSTASSQQRQRIDDDSYWNAKYRLLKQFYELYEHHHVPINWGDTNLKGWVLEQVELVNAAEVSTLTPERREKLAAVGIAPTQIDTSTHPVPPICVADPVTGKRLYASMWEQRWEDKYLNLVEFAKKHDGFVNCNTKRGYQLDLRLAEWVQIQRENLRLGVVRSDRQQKLEQIGVETLRLAVDVRGIN